MLIQKKRAVKWSLDQVEAIPGITTQGIMEECIRNMDRNGWDFTEMAAWFNRQHTADGRPKFLNAVGGPLSGPNVAHIASQMRRRKKGAKPKVVPVKLDFTPYQELASELFGQGKGPNEIFKVLVDRLQFTGNYHHVRNFIHRNLKPKVEPAKGEPITKIVEPAVAPTQPATKSKLLPQMISTCEPHREFIRHLLILGKTPTEVHRLLTVHRGYSGGTSSVRRFVRSVQREAAQAAGVPYDGREGDWNRGGRNLSGENNGKNESISGASNQQPRTC